MSLEDRILETSKRFTREVKQAKGGIAEERVSMTKSIQGERESLAEELRQRQQQVHVERSALGHDRSRAEVVAAEVDDEAEDHHATVARGRPFEVMDEVETMDGVAFLKLADQDLFAKKAECEQHMDIIDEGSGRLKGVYSVVAFLRILYLLLNMPRRDQLRAEECRRLVRKAYSVPHAFLELLTMANHSLVGALSCNVTAKLLCVVTCLLKVDHSDEDEVVSDKKLELFAIMSTYIDRLSRSMLQVLQLTSTGYLKEREQILCAELTAFFREAVGAIAAVEEPKEQKQASPHQGPEQHAKSRHDRHRERVNFCLQWLVPESALELLVGVVLYDLRTNSLGRAAHPSLGHGFVQHMSELKCRMAADATSVLSRLMAAKPQQSLGQAAGLDYRYAVLERLNWADVFGHQVLRNSYLSQLLGGARAWEVAAEIEKQWDAVEKEKGSYFPMQGSKDGRLPKDRLTQVLIIEQVSTSKVRQPGASAYLCCTVWEVALVAKEGSQDRLNFLWKKKYTDVERIFRCYGSQAIVFRFNDGSLSKLAFHRDTVRDEIIAHVGRKRAVAGEGSGDDFQFVINATGMKREIKEQVEDAKVVAATVTSGGPEQPGETILWTLSVPVTCLMVQPITLKPSEKENPKTILKVVPIQGFRVGDRILISSGSKSVTRHIMSFRKVILEEPLTSSQGRPGRAADEPLLNVGDEFETKSGFGTRGIKGKLTSEAHVDSEELCITIPDFETKPPDVFRDPKKRDKSWSEFTSGVRLSFRSGDIVVRVKFLDELVVEDRMVEDRIDRIDRAFPADARVIKLEGRIDKYKLILDSWQPPDYLPQTEENNPQEYFGVDIVPAKIKRRYKDAKDKRAKEKSEDAKKNAVARMRDHMAGVFVKEETPVLTHQSTYTLPPKQVIFEHGPEPELTMTFADPQDGSTKERVTMHFLDDAGRERWRQALAWFIAKLGTGWRRE